jgi:general secretion pathway protein A
MLLDFYNLKEQPFGVTPDPRYLYPSPTHREALASLAYGVQSGRGFMSIIATPGMGKTTILYQLLQSLESSARIAFLCQTLCRPQDIMRGVLRDLGVDNDSTDLLRMESQLNGMLLAEARRGRKVVVVIDEAQNLDDSALEVVRLLSNFETSNDKLVQIILAGQAQLRERLESPRLLQLRQRMSIIARLEAFSAKETRLYIAHRLRVAGYGFNTPLFTPEAEAMVARYSDGIPRNINNICFNALSLGYVVKQTTIQKDVIREVVDDLDLSAKVFNGRAHESARHKITRIGNAPRALSRPSLAWYKKVAVCALMAVVLIFVGGREQLGVFGSHSLTAVSAASNITPKNLVAVVPAHSEPSYAIPVNSEAQPSASQHSKTPPTVLLADLPKTRRQRRWNLANPSDPDQLWAQVRKQNSNAEVELARMYLEGSAVPKNCQQAQVLLLAASRKGNIRAADLLTNSGSQCADVPASQGEQP